MQKTNSQLQQNIMNAVKNGGTIEFQHIHPTKVENYMHGGGPSPSGSNFRHSYGFAAVSSAHTSANGLFPGIMHQIIP